MIPVRAHNSSHQRGRARGFAVEDLQHWKVIALGARVSEDGEALKEASQRSDPEAHEP
jgi:hypothetical protein